LFIIKAQVDWGSRPQKCASRHIGMSFGATKFDHLRLHLGVKVLINGWIVGGMQNRKQKN
jgi:hypothetical protein